MQGRLLAVASMLVLACAAGVPAAPSSGTAVAWGYVKLVPSGGAVATGGAYADRRLRDAELVDYSRPGFAIVYVASARAGGGRAVAAHREGRDVSLTVEAGAVGPRLTPRNAVLGLGDRIVVRNRTSVAQLVSCPSADIVEMLAPGERVALSLREQGEHAVHLLGGARARATLFVAPGRFAVVSPAGRWVLRDLPPGATVLRSWHPRLPPSEVFVDLATGEVLRRDIEIGVGLREVTGLDQESNIGLP